MKLNVIDKNILNKTETYHGTEINRTGIKGVWTLNSFNPSKCKIHGHLNDNELTRIYSDHYTAYVNGKTPNKMPLCCNPKVEVRKNTVCNGLINTIIHRMINGYTGTEDIIARKLAVGTGNQVAQQTDAQLSLEKFRSDFTEKFQDTNKAAFVLLINRTNGNGNETVIIADGTNTTSYFKIDVGDAATFNIGDRIRVTTSTSEFFTDVIDRDVINDFLTISPVLPEAPIAGKRVIQAWAEAGVFGNSNAGSSSNTGSLYNRVNQLEFVKDNTKIILIEVQFIFTAA